MQFGCGVFKNHLALFDIFPARHRFLILFLILICAVERIEESLFSVRFRDSEFKYIFSNYITKDYKPSNKARTF